MTFTSSLWLCRTDEQQQPTDQAFADSGGEQAAADLLPDLAALFAADDVQAGSIPPDGAPTKQTGDAPQQAEPSQRIGGMRHACCSPSAGGTAASRASLAPLALLAKLLARLPCLPTCRPDGQPAGSAPWLCHA